MQKVIRVAIVILLALVTVAIIYSQAKLYRQQHPLSWGKEAQITFAQPQQPGTPAASAADIQREAAEHEKDRDLLRSIERDAARLAASSLAQNYLMLFQAIIYFLTLIIIFSLLETVKKFADVASKSAEASRLSAEAAGRASGQGQAPHCGKKRPDVNKFIMRRLRGNYYKR